MVATRYPIPRGVLAQRALGPYKPNGFPNYALTQSLTLLDEITIRDR